MHTQVFVLVSEIAMRLAQVAQREILAGNYGHVKDSFAFAEKWLREGSRVEKLAIANVFLFSLASTIDRMGKQGRNIQALLPPLLNQEYLAQINAQSV